MPTEAMVETVGALAILGAVVFFLMKYTIVQTTANSKEHAKATERIVSMIQSESRIVVIAILGFQQQLLAHDLTTTGLNPTGGDVDERVAGAIRKHEDVEGQISDLRALLLAKGGVSVV